VNVVGHVPAPSIAFCIPPNPVPGALALHAELALYKLRHCRNIAGVERQLEPYAAPTDTVSGLPMIGAGGRLVLPGTVRLQPTPYRYAALIERTRQLAQQAQQFEGAMLSAIEKGEEEQYKVLKARQEVRLTQAGVRLQTLRLREAEHGIVLAELQQRRAEIQQEHFSALLEEGLSTLEGAAIGFMVGAAALHTVAAGIYASVITDRESAARAATETAAAASVTASILSTYASYERREQEWRLQRALAEHDTLIGSQQVTLAQDHTRIVGQELTIAELQADQAQATADFLANKFTNAELYDWMSGILEGVYAFFLQQATAMAKLAEHQLAFERQEVPQAIVQADYWDAPSDFAEGAPGQRKAPDRRGLTGSARLLQDVQALEQHAFETDRRKLQLSKTISLARLAPVEFARLRETGVIVFATPSSLFDRDFPGHHLRLIKRVRTSIVALVPPTEGVHATLTTVGLSRVVIGPEVFQTVVVRRSPESVALTSARDASGVFELQAQPDLLLPFEGTGVDTVWELRLPKAANALDYGTVADVLLTIDYTALDSFEHRQQVVAELGTTVSLDRSLSFRHQLPDQWYDLHYPDRTAAPMKVAFRTRREDFPPHLQRLRIQHVVVFFARPDGAALEVPVTQLRLRADAAAAWAGGGGASLDGAISTRRGNAPNWVPLIGASPVGEWELELPDTPAMRDRFRKDAAAGEEIQDILLVLTCAGDSPEWPA
jgi:hypothetical protein